MVYATKGNKRYVLVPDFKLKPKTPTLAPQSESSGFYASTVLVGLDHRPATVLKAAFNIFWRLNYASSFLDLERCKKYSLELYWSPFILLFPLFLRIFL